MKLTWASVCALVMLVAHPAMTFAQYQERWAANLTLGTTSLAPSNLGDIDGDGQLEAVGSVLVGSTFYVQVRDALTGAVEFTSTTGIPNFSQWTIYILDLDNNAGDKEILASSGNSVLVIDHLGTVSVPANEVQGMRQTLFPARPNPFVGQVSLAYSLPAPGTVELEIYDVAGRLVQRLGGQRMEAGEHKVDWDGRDQGGRSLEPGMYFYRLTVDGHASEAQRAVRLGH